MADRGFGTVALLHWIMNVVLDLEGHTFGGDQVRLVCVDDVDVDVKRYI